MVGRVKGRYFSVRFSAELLERIDFARTEFFGTRCTLAEAIRRLIEDRVSQLEMRTGLSSIPRPRVYGPNLRVQGTSVPTSPNGSHDSMPLATVASPFTTRDTIWRLAEALRRQAADLSRAALDLEWILLEEGRSDPDRVPGQLERPVPRDAVSGSTR